MNKPTCSIDGCERGGKIVRGWCSLHYGRWRKHGDPLHNMIPRCSTPEESFAIRTERQGDCVVWIGGKTSKGYGLITTGGKRQHAHRFAWEQAHGPIPAGAVVDHYLHCDPACVTVSHLRLATNAENVAHRRTANRNNKASGVRNVEPNCNGWAVRIKKNRKSYYFGTYPTIEEASAVAERERINLFGSFSGQG